MENFFKNKAIITNGIYNLTPLQAHNLCQKGAILLDVREDYLNRYKIFDVPEQIFCPKKKLAEHLTDLPLDTPLIIADASGIHSPEAVKTLIEQGFIGSVANLSGGLVDWEHAGLPITINYNERIPGALVKKMEDESKD